MKKIIILSFLTLSIIGCKEKQDSKKNTINEITGAIGFFENENGVEVKSTRDKKILYWCYDLERLLKIDLLGKASDVSIDVITVDNKTKNIMENAEIDGSYSITPMQYNSLLTGGKIVVKSGSKVIYELVISYEGCL